MIKSRRKEDILIMDKIKTFDDACKELGEDHPYVKAYNEWMKVSFEECEDITAYLKLRIITASLNNGWEPQFKLHEDRWCFGYEIIDNNLEFLRFPDYGLDFSKYSIYPANKESVCIAPEAVSSYDGGPYSAKLCFRRRILAEYAAQQFPDIFVDYFYNKKKQ